MLTAKTEEASASGSPTSVKSGALFGAVHRPGSVYAASLHLAIFVAAFVVIVWRRPDAVLNAQFFAEDGMVWFSDAYNFGIRSLRLPEASYLHTLTRLIALLSLTVPFVLAPLIMNLCAIIVQILPVNVFLSSRFSRIPVRVRLFGSLLYLALPNSYEIDANVTTLQWHLALLAFLLVLAEPAASWGWRIFSGVVLVLISLDGPMGIVLIPFAAYLWLRRKEPGAVANLALLLPGAAVQVLNIAVSWHSRPVSHIGASFTRLVTIVGRQIFVSLFLGLNTTSNLFRGEVPTVVEITVTVLALALLVFALRNAPVDLKLCIIFAFAVFALCLARPLAGPPDRQQWAWLCVPGVGNRYYFLPMLSFVGVLVWMATNSSYKATRYLGIVLLLMLPYSVYQDWSYPEFRDLKFKEHAAEFERAPLGTKVQIPVNPGYTLELIKH